MNGDERVALVTGANRGIGLEVGRQLHARGFTVIFGARDEKKERKPFQPSMDTIALSSFL